MKEYESLFTQSRNQMKATAFASFFPPQGGTYDTPFIWLAEKTSEKKSGWAFSQEKYIKKHPSTEVPKLKNYLNYTFIRLQTLEAKEPNKYFVFSPDKNYVCFNTGLQDDYGVDIIIYFSKFIPNKNQDDHTDWVYKGFLTPNSKKYIDTFGESKPELAWYTTDSRDYIFDLSYTLNKELFEHVFIRAKERAGLPEASDEIVKNYLSGVLDGLIPKIKRNYKVAIPIYYIQEKKMQLLLPFKAASGENFSAFLVERDDERKRYNLKTILDMDHAFFAARLITRPDEDWLNP